MNPGYQRVSNDGQSSKYTTEWLKEERIKVYIFALNQSPDFNLFKMSAKLMLYFLQ